MTRSPILSGARRGFVVATIIVAAAAALAALLFGADYLMKPDHGTGLSLITGFLILPLMVLSGLPWSLIALRFGHSPAVGAPLLAASVLANGAILGALLGAFRKSKGRASNGGSLDTD
jgi:hypothetical protein